MNRARSYIYTTATPQLLAVALMESLAIVASEDERRSQLARLIALLGEARDALPGTLLPSSTPIQPLVLGAPDAAVRLRVEGSGEPFVDELQGPVDASALTDLGDFVIRRRDGLPAYHLAVVVDDGAQGVTAIVRGVDVRGGETAAEAGVARSGLPGTH